MQRRLFSLGLGLLLVIALAVGASAGELGGYGGGGPLVGVLRLDLSGLNEELGAHGFSEMNGDIIVFGGGGAGGTLGWNVGGWGFGGEVVSTAADSEARLMIGAGGFNIQRTLPIGALTLQSGVMIGGGSAELNIVDIANPTLEDAISQRYETTIKNDFFAVLPTVGMRVKLTDFLFVQADGGYLLTIGDWKFQDHSMADLPRIGGPMIKVGLVFGGSTK